MAEYENLREITTLAETMKEQQAWVVLEVACILVILVGMMIIGLCIILFINKTNENTNNLLQYYELKDEQEKRKTSISI
jgi:hypothetical protein